MLNGKTVLITGASSGIGAACSKAFAKAGVSTLILIARRDERLQALATKIKTSNDINIITHCLDVRDLKAVKQQLATLNTPVDILINNAGLAAGLDTLAEADIDDWEAMIDTNVKGLLYISRQLLPGMLSRGHGHIINISSLAGHRAYAKGSVYCATKFAVKAISRALTQECIGTGVKVTDLAPGLVETEFSQVRFKGDQNKADAVYRDLTPLSAEDVAETIAFCASRPAHVNIPELVVLATDQGMQLA